MRVGPLASLSDLPSVRARGRRDRTETFVGLWLWFCSVSVHHPCGAKKNKRLRPGLREVPRSPPPANTLSTRAKQCVTVVSLASLSSLLSLSPVSLLSFVVAPFTFHKTPHLPTYCFEKHLSQRRLTFRPTVLKNQTKSY